MKARVSYQSSRVPTTIQCPTFRDVRALRSTFFYHKKKKKRNVRVRVTASRHMEKELIRFLPKMEEIEALGLHNNCTSLISSTVDVEEVFAKETQSEYEQFLADVWVGIILTLIVLSCVCCMCSCLLYHKFQQWKRSSTYCYFYFIFLALFDCCNY